MIFRLMAQVMEFILNLLLLRGKSLTKTAAEALQEALQRCVKVKNNFTKEYNKATNMIGPYENMLEFVNFNSSEYTCEGENYIVTTSEVHCRLYEHLNQIQKSSNQEFNSNKDKTTSEIPNQVKLEIAPAQNLPDIRQRNCEHFVDNLQAILKSQEFLFNNIIKLVDLLESDRLTNPKDKKLQNIKNKLAACSDILTNNGSPSRNFADIINNIIEDEITRCRFRNGECKTSAQICLKVPQPKGLEIVLEPPEVKSSPKTKKIKSRKLLPPKNHQHQLLNRQRIDFEVRSNSEKLLKRTQSEPINLLRRGSHNLPEKANLVKEQIILDVENAKQLIQMNEQCFQQFEEKLWHSLTTTKYLSLKDDYLNQCKCAFYNKRQFRSLEARILKRTQQEEEIENMGRLLSLNDAMLQIMERKLLFDEATQHSSLQEMEDINDVLCKVIQEFERNSVFQAHLNLEKKALSVKNEVQETKDNETNTVISGHFLPKCSTTITKFGEKDDKNDKNKMGRRKFSSKLPIAENIEKAKTKRKKKKSDSASLPVETNREKDEKMVTIQEVNCLEQKIENKNKIPERFFSLHDLKHAADLLRTNKKAFDDFEKTLKVVKLVKTERKKSNKSRTEMEKKKSTKEVPLKLKQLSQAKGDNLTFVKCKNQENTIMKDKCKTFLKSDADVTSFSPRKVKIKSNDSLHVNVKSVHGDKKQFNMRRTTKAAMKKQQVLTILPKSEKKVEEKKINPKISTIAKDHKKVKQTVSNDNIEKEGNEKEKIIKYSSLSNKDSKIIKVGEGESSKKIQCVKWIEDDVTHLLSLLFD